MPAPDLSDLKAPIALRNEHIVDKQTAFRVQQHGKGLHSGNFTIFYPNNVENTETPAEPQTLFTVEGKYGILQERRSFRDASGLPLFHLYHKPIGVTWYIELPGGNDTAIARLAPNFSLFKDNMEVHIKNAAPSTHQEYDVTLQVRGQDIWKQRTNVYLGEKIVMTAKRTDKLSTYLPGRKIEWDVNVAAGMDLSLASAIVVVMAANMYNSSMQASSAK
ncbi:hypothetical protein AC579_7758 [Pseudocercospora musae]|uniref:Tubby C-terminal-like domain-containing protein n=1 Tax=Pseudocercospora musae TaxID=113226 RepID=A0A139IK50_9PEZI|nr:hypothetical protein AC579_7758 [Pseudocercospora musae]